MSQTTPATDVVHQHWQSGPLVAALLLLTAAMADMQLRLPLNRTAQRRSADRASSPKLKCRRLPLSVVQPVQQVVATPSKNPSTCVNSPQSTGAKEHPIDTTKVRGTRKRPMVPGSPMGTWLSTSRS